jgi:uncharacterized membrane protein YgaE (UPF0421/DUF939 family)
MPPFLKNIQRLIVMGYLLTEMKETNTVKLTCVVYAMKFFRRFYRKFVSPIIKAFQGIEFKLAIKTGVAAGISFSLGIFLNEIFQQASIPISELWCTMSSMLVLQAHTGGTYKAARERVLGVVIGSFLGSFFCAILGSNPLLLALCITSTIILCTLGNLKESVRIACLSVAVIMVIFTTQSHVSPWLFGFHRFIDSVLGIIVGISVSLLLWPSRATRKIRKDFANIVTALAELLSVASGSEEGNAFTVLEEEINKLLEESGSHFDEAELELVFRESKLEAWVLFSQTVEKVLRLLTLLKYSSSIRQELDSNLNNHIDHFVLSVVKVLEHLSTQLTKGKSDKSSTDKIDLAEAFRQVEIDYQTFVNQEATKKMDTEQAEKLAVFFYCLRKLSQELIILEELALKICVHIKGGV